jgi:MoaA/NifB/PqqE/SkfB family radical SAM enzyme
MRNRVFQLVNAITRRKIAFELDRVPLRFENLSMRKIANWIFTESSVQFKPSQPWGLPTILQVEPSSNCNLHCRVCPVGRGLERPSGNMTEELFIRLIDDLAESVLVLMFWDWGEPFLNPNAYNMIQYARRAGIKVVASTNGHLFADRQNATKVIESGLDVLVVSVDGMDQHTFQNFRTGGNLETVLQGIRNVVEEKHRTGSSLPLLNLRFIVTKNNEHQVPRLQSYARALGIDILTLRKFHFVPGTDASTSDNQGQLNSCPEGMIPSNSMYQLPVLTDDKLPERLRRNPCKNLWNCPSIHWNGAVCSCFMDYNEKNPLGSLQTQSFREIWRGNPYARLRRAFRRSWSDLALCGQCASGYLQGDVGRQANAEVIHF